MNVTNNKTTDSTKTGYPLKIVATTVVVENSPFDKEMVLKMLPRLNYPAVVQAGQELASKLTDQNKPTELPAELPANHQDDENFLQTLHYVLFDIHLVEGFLICPGSGRRFPVKDSIPNMILHEDEL